MKELFRYRAKTLFTGYKIGLMNPSLYIGVPKKYFYNHNSIPVEHDGKVKYFHYKEAESEKTFNDRFMPGTIYTLLYFLWKRVKRKELKEIK